MKSNRPKSMESVWSTDANFPAGANPWNATATKVQPPSGEVAGGAKPDQKFPAAWFNWHLNKVDKGLAYLDGSDALNYDPEVYVGAVGFPAFMMATKYALGYDQYHGRYYATYDGPMMFKSHTGGRVWANANADLGVTLSGAYGIAFNPTTGVGYILGLNNAARKIATSVAWTVIAWTNLTDGKGIFWDPYRSQFVAFGAATAGAAQVWTANDTTITQATMTGAPITAPIYACAAGPNGLVAIHGTAGTHRVWTSPTGATWTVNNPAISVGNYDLDYDDGRDEFVMLAASFIYTSPDGITWTSAGGAITAPGGLPVVFTRQILTYGGIWVVTGETSRAGESDQDCVVVSLDRGITWELVRVGALGLSRSLCRHAGRIMIANNQTGVGAGIVFSKRAR